jgi:tetratricopeptide (TPR) repeat protein
MAFEKQRVEGRLKNAGKAFLSLLRKRKRLVEYTLTIILVSAGVLAYFMIQKGSPSGTFVRPDVFDRDLREALNLYRLEEYDRSEILLKHVIARSGRRRTKSLAAFYLGNIRFKNDLYRDALALYYESLSYDRKNVNALYNSAVVLSKTGQWRQAQERIEKVLTLQPDFRKALLFLGNMYYGAGRFEKAEEIYAKKPGDPVFIFNRAMTYSRMNRIQEAADLLATLTSSTDTKEILRGAAAYEAAVLLQKEDPYRSMRYLQEAHALFPGSDTVQYDLAYLLMKTAQYGEAADILAGLAANPVYSEKTEYVSLYSFALMKSGRYTDALNYIVHLHSRNGEARTAQIAGDLFLEKGDLVRAQQYYEEAVKGTTGAHSYANLVQIYILHDRYERALNLCDEFERQYPESVLPLISRADVLFSSGDNRNARQYIQRAAERSLTGLVEAGDLYRKHELYDNALELYSRYIDEEPTDMSVWERIADTYMETGHTERARVIYEKIKNGAVDPFRYYRSSILLASMGHGDAARTVYEGLIHDFPYRYEAYYNLALLFLKGGEYSEASSIAHQCLEKNPGLSIHARVRMFTVSGIACTYLERFEDAAKEFAAARSLDASDLDVIRYMEILGSRVQ